MTASYTQKEIATILDRAADRAEMINQRPASGKQCWFLAKLILQDGCDPVQFDDSNFVLSIREASSAIDMFLKAA